MPQVVQEYQVVQEFQVCQIYQVGQVDLADPMSLDLLVHTGRVQCERAHVLGLLWNLKGKEKA